MASTSPVRAPKPSAKRPESLRERLHEREITELITAYHDGATATSHGVSLKSAKRLLRAAGIRRTTHTRQAPKATLATTIRRHFRPAFTARFAA